MLPFVAELEQLKAASQNLTQGGAATGKVLHSAFRYCRPPTHNSQQRQDQNPALTVLYLPNLADGDRTQVRHPAQPSANHPGGNPGPNLKSISHRCHPILVALVWELTEKNINLPLGRLQDGHPLSQSLEMCLGCRTVFDKAPIQGPEARHLGDGLCGSGAGWLYLLQRLHTAEDTHCP